MQADIDEIRGGGERRTALRDVVDAEGGVMARQQIHDRRLEPGFVAELECCAQPLGPNDIEELG